MDFQQAREQFNQLKSRLDSGQLAEADFKAKLQELMVQDEQGCWWMIGKETGQWYRHDGTDWVRADPPVLVPAPAIPAGEPVPAQPIPAAHTAAMAQPVVHAEHMNLRPGWIAVLWITLGWAAGAAVVVLLLLLLGAPSDYLTHKSVSYFIWYVGMEDRIMPVFASMFLLAGLAGLFTALALRSQGVISNWKTVLSISLAWAICMALFTPQNMLPLAGALGGLVMALILRFAGALSDWKDLLWIAASWAIPWLAPVLQQGVPMSTSIALLAGGAAIPAFILVWRLRQEDQRMGATLRAGSLSI